MASIPRWDLRPTDPDYRRPKPTDMRLRLRASLERKVCDMEAYEAGTGPAPDPMPTNRTMLREWENLEERLYAWKDPKVDDPSGKNADLMARFSDVCRRIRAQREEPRRKVTEAEASGSELSRLKLERVTLLEQAALSLEERLRIAK